MSERTLLSRTIELETLAHDVTQRIGRARRNLSDSLGGFPATTPGNGSPGSGKGGTSHSRVEAQAIEGRLDVPAVELERLATTGRAVCSALEDLVAELVGQRPVTPGDDATPTQLAAQALRCATVARGLAQHSVVGSERAVHRCEVPLWRWHRAVVAWSFIPGRAAVRDEAKPVDLTGMWCVSCLRVGEREPRYRRDLCQWCCRFEMAEGFAVPIELVQARHEQHERITDAMVQPFRDRHRHAQRTRVGTDQA